jgi:hypothetical protein
MTYPNQANGADPFTDTATGVKVPKPRHLANRTVIYVPRSIDETAMYKNASRPSVVADLIVCDGGPVRYGDDEDKHTPATHESATPAMWRGIQIANTAIVGALRPIVGQGIRVGVIVMGTSAFLLENLDTADPRRAAAAQLWFAIQSGSFVNPAPVELAQPGLAGGVVAQAQSYAQPVQAAAAPAPAGSIPPPPAGWDPGAWLGLTDAQRAQFLAGAPTRF